MEKELNIGCEYTYVFTNEKKEYEFHVSGTIIYNDGLFAIMKVDYLDMDCWGFVSNYSIVKKFFPEFNDSEANDSSKYFCLTADEGDFYYLDPNYWIRREGNLEVGSIYTHGKYTTDYYKCSLRGVVVYNDGEDAVIRVIKEENGPDIEDLLYGPNKLDDVELFSYDELQEMNPDFNDPKADNKTKYFIIDVETRSSQSQNDLMYADTPEETNPSGTQLSSDEELELPW